MDKLTLEKIHEIDISILKEVHKICERYSIRYFLLGGSMLGAIRHRGFIPWDDDIDIGMPRRDYERFINVCNTKLPSNLKMCTYYNNEKHVHNFGKIENTNTVLIDENFKHIGERGVFIDVFPLDGASEKKMMRMLHLAYINFLQDMIIIMNVNKDKKRNVFKSFVIKTIHSLNIDAKRINYRLDNILKKYDYDNSNIISNYTGKWREKEMMKKSIMGTPTLVEFEDEKYYGVEYPHEYLKNLYGETYMSPPPKSERTSHHKFTVKFLD